MKKQVLTFIQYMNSEIRERPQCMLFAMILKLRFDSAQIKYSTGHFITLIDGYHYDWDGVWIDSTKGFTEFPKGWGDIHIVNHYNAIKEIMSR